MKPSPLCIVVVVYNMRREAPRTLLSLSARYQRGVSADDYQIHVIENGSPEPLDEALVMSFGPNFRYTNLGPRALPSPCRAINQAVMASSSAQVGVMIDGARIASPGLIAGAIKALQLGRDPVVATLAWHLGDAPQYVSVAGGYCQAVEDRLLAQSPKPPTHESMAQAPSSQRGRALARMHFLLHPPQWAASFCVSISQPSL